jgi:hypothetical protein
VKGRAILRSAVALAVGFGGTAAALALRDLSQSDPAQGARLGTLDVARYCRDVYGPEATAINPTLDAFGWKCALRANGVFASKEVDPSTACEQQYGNDAFADSFDPSYFDSWECFVGPRPRTAQSPIDAS